MAESRCRDAADDFGGPRCRELAAGETSFFAFFFVSSTKFLTLQMIQFSIALSTYVFPGGWLYTSIFVVGFFGQSLHFITYCILSRVQFQISNDRYRRKTLRRHSGASWRQCCGLKSERKTPAPAHPPLFFLAYNPRNTRNQRA